MDGVDERTVGRALVPPVRVLDQVDLLVVDPLRHHVGACADRLLLEGLEAFLHGVVDGPDGHDRMAHARRELGERILEGDLDGPVADRLDAREAVLGGARLVGADDGLEDVRRRACDPVLRVGDGVPAGHHVGRLDLAVHRRLEHDALPDGEGEGLGVGAHFVARAKARHCVHGDAVGCDLVLEQAFEDLAHDVVADALLVGVRGDPHRLTIERVVVGAAGFRRAAAAATAARVALAAAGRQDEGERYEHNSYDQRPP